MKSLTSQKHSLSQDEEAEAEEEEEEWWELRQQLLVRASRTGHSTTSVIMVSAVQPGRRSNWWH